MLAMAKRKSHYTVSLSADMHGNGDVIFRLGWEMVLGALEPCRLVVDTDNPLRGLLGLRAHQNVGRRGDEGGGHRAVQGCRKRGRLWAAQPDFVGVRSFAAAAAGVADLKLQLLQVPPTVWFFPIVYIGKIAVIYGRAREWTSWPAAGQTAFVEPTRP